MHYYLVRTRYLVSTNRASYKTSYIVGGVIKNHEKSSDIICELKNCMYFLYFLYLLQY